MKHLRHFFHRTLGLALLLLASACAQSSEGAKEKTTSAGQVIGYNHTHEYIHQFYVDDSGGGNAQPYGNGGSSCCVTYPKQWRPDLLVTVRWTTSSADPNAKGEDAVGKWHSTTVPIDQYTKPGEVNVHFLPEGKVRIVISTKTAHHPEYPGPAYPVAPPDFKFKF